MDLVERIFQKGRFSFILYMFVILGMLSPLLMQSEIIIYGLVRKCVKLLPFLLDNIYIRFHSVLTRCIMNRKLPMRNSNLHDNPQTYTKDELH